MSEFSAEEEPNSGQTKGDAKSQTNEANHWKTLARLSRYLWPPGRFDLRLRAVLAFCALLLSKMINVCVPFFYKGAVDSLGAEAALVTVPVAMIVGYGVTRVLQQGFGELRDVIFARVSQHAQRVVARDTFEHLHGLSLRFHLSRRTGGLSRVIERGTHGIQFVLSFMLFNIVPTLLEILLVTAVLYWFYGAAFAALCFGTIACYIAYTMAVTDWRLKLRREMNKSDSEASSRSVDSLINYETVKYFSNEELESTRFDKVLSRYEEAAVKSQTSLGVLNIGQGLIIGLGLVGVMWLAASHVVNGSGTIGDFVLVNTYLIQLYLPLNFLGYVYREIRQSLTDMEKMFSFLAVKQEVTDAPESQPIEARDGEVRFENVSFGYHAERGILNDISFTIPKGKKLAVVGPSGAGKSTLLRLLFRFFDVDGGRITIDGVDIRDVTQGSVRHLLGIVPQDTVLFNDTIYYNIHYGRPDATHEDVVAAAKMAQIHEFIVSLPQGYDSVVGERGLKLSGGEKQRIAIARAVLKDPKIMVFDEATSALDTHTEKEIQASLRKLAEDRSTLIIAHRLSTVVDADEIIVLEGGGITERGTHSQLLAAGGEYARMWYKQLEVEQYQQKLEEIES